MKLIEKGELEEDVKTAWSSFSSSVSMCRTVLLTKIGLFIRDSLGGHAACLSVCAAAQLPAVACPCLHEPGFCVLLCSGWASFHVEHVVHSSCSKCWRGEFWPCAACWSSGWKCTEQNKENKKTYVHARLIALKKILSLGLSLAFSVRFPEEVLLVFL